MRQSQQDLLALAHHALPLHPVLFAPCHFLLLLPIMLLPLTPERIGLPTFHFARHVEILPTSWLIVLLAPAHHPLPLRPVLFAPHHFLLLLRIMLLLPTQKRIGLSKNRRRVCGCSPLWRSEEFPAESAAASFLCGDVVRPRPSDSRAVSAAKLKEASNSCGRPLRTAAYHRWLQPSPRSRHMRRPRSNTAAASGHSAGRLPGRPDQRCIVRVSSAGPNVLAMCTSY